MQSFITKCKGFVKLYARLSYIYKILPVNVGVDWNWISKRLTQLEKILRKDINSRFYVTLNK